MLAGARRAASIVKTSSQAARCLSSQGPLATCSARVWQGRRCADPPRPARLLSKRREESKSNEREKEPLTPPWPHVDLFSSKYDEEPHRKWREAEEQKTWRGRGGKTGIRRIETKEVRAQMRQKKKKFKYSATGGDDAQESTEEAPQHDGSMGWYAKGGKKRLFGVKPYEGRDNFGRGPSQYAKVKKLTKKAHKKIGGDMSPEIFRAQRVLMRTLREAGQEKDSEKAEMVLLDALAHADADRLIDTMTYNTVINIFAKCQRWEKAVDWLNRMRTTEGSPKPDIFTYNSAMHACGNCGKWDMAMQLFRQMENEDGIAPDIANFNTAMQACVKGREWEKAMAMLAEIKDTNGVNPDIVSYCTAIAACGGSKRWQQALDILKEISFVGLKPNIVAYTTAMQACLDSGEWQQALDVLQEIRDEDMVKPNLVTYNKAIEACCAVDGSRWEQAYELFRHMDTDKVRPNVVTYRSIIKALVGGGRWEETVTVLEEMKTKHGISPKNATVYQSAMKVCGDCDQPAKVVEVFEHAEAEGVIKPQVGMYNMAVDAYGALGECEKVYELLETMKARDVKGDIATYRSAVVTSVECGQWEKASALYIEMKLLGLKPNAEVYNAVLRACEAAGQDGMAFDVWSEMKAEGIASASSAQ